MNNTTVNLTTPEAFSNSTSLSIDIMTRLEICVGIINFLFGLPAHSYVIWLIVSGTRNEVASGFFNLNLSVCEIGNCLNSFLTVMDCVHSFSSLKVLTNFTLGLAITGRPVFQCLICVERYLAVVHPVTFLKFKPLRYRVICSTAAWIISLGSCFSMLSVVSQNKYISVWFFSMQFLICISVQLFCLLAVLRALKQSGPGERGREREEENHMKRRAFYLILIITVSMFLLLFSIQLFCLSAVLRALKQSGPVLVDFNIYCFTFGVRSGMATHKMVQRGQEAKRGQVESATKEDVN
ncbi:G-protein coupled receptor 4-like [Myxocyprinus asiaticus]|uniref:G-protein coupled receptor 4-like n=1 Tax=Myxocyprinus asiaticus TaxID=70543 RepID=UPI002223D21D|nr:G-protein coupled receptor 4-like [Myxocyprinus asiaticus]